MILGLAILAFVPSILVVGQLKLSHIINQMTDHVEDGS